MPLPPGLDRNQTIGLIRNSIKLKAQAMGVTLREVPIDALSVANEQYVQRMEVRRPAKYVKALAQAEMLSAAAGYDSVLAAVKDTCDNTVISTAWFNWAAKDARGLSKPTNVVLAFKNSYNAQVRRYQVILVGVALYGKFDAKEPADSDSDDADRAITFESGPNGQPTVSAEHLNQAAARKRAGIIEVLCRRNNAMSRGIGSLLVQHCVMRSMTYTLHPSRVIFTNLVRSNRYHELDPVEAHYAASRVFTACGFRHVPSIRFRPVGAGDDAPGTTDEKETGRWYALGGDRWQDRFAESLTAELENLYPICPVTPRVRTSLARC